MSYDVERLEAIRRRGARVHALSAPITGDGLARLAICDAAAAEDFLDKLERAYTGSSASVRTSALDGRSV